MTELSWSGAGDDELAKALDSFGTYLKNRPAAADDQIVPPDRDWAELTAQDLPVD